MCHRGAASSMSAPLDPYAVVVLNDHDLNDDLDSVDPGQQQTLADGVQFRHS